MRAFTEPAQLPSDTLRRHVYTGGLMADDAAVSIAVPDKFAQPARWRAFRDPVIEASFRAWLRERTVPIARLTAIASGLARLTIPVWYSLIFGEVPDEFLISAWAIAVPTSALPCCLSPTDGCCDGSTKSR